MQALSPQLSAALAALVAIISLSICDRAIRRALCVVPTCGGRGESASRLHLARVKAGE